MTASAVSCSRIVSHQREDLTGLRFKATQQLHFDVGGSEQPPRDIDLVISVFCARRCLARLKPADFKHERLDLTTKIKIVLNIGDACQQLAIFQRFTHA